MSVCECLAKRPRRKQEKNLRLYRPASLAAHWLLTSGGKPGDNMGRAGARKALRDGGVEG